MSAIRLARGITGRRGDRQVRRLLPRARRRAARPGRLRGGHPRACRPAPASPGRRPPTPIVLPYNDLDAVRAVFAERGADIACVITEAAAGNMGAIAPRPGFNAGLREICHAHGRAAGDRRGDDRVPGVRRPAGSGWTGSPATSTRSARSCPVGCRPRRSAARRRTWLTSPRPGRSTRPGRCPGTRSRSPPGLATLRAADADVYAALDANAAPAGRADRRRRWAPRVCRTASSSRATCCRCSSPTTRCTTTRARRPQPPGGSRPSSTRCWTAGCTRRRARSRRGSSPRRSTTTPGR